ncbi:glycosyltransferase [Ovoidimarina sediminis]|uniref:glycosyltransferase n=1 Tax=Ovoidimarina sediminis TaxID=3079856 RepID=UPI002906A0DB|nr:glycosyltransferase [Rhodophyticola sp. MJ-SS7]MDU8943184.1 glycosyltransferase [Rhodophyticola sp. MJ-SS7]
MTHRVAHVLNSPGRGGVPRVVRALVTHADPGRISPHVFYLKNGRGDDLFEDLDIPRRVAASGSKSAAMTELVGWLDAHRIDILHCHSFRPNLYGRMAGAVLRPAGLRIVAHYHNDYSDKWTGDALHLERRLAGVTDAGIAVSEAVADHVAKRVGRVPDVIENGVDFGRIRGGNRGAGRARLGIAADELAVGLVGRICRQKGTDIFVEAAISVLASLPQVRFLILGDPEEAALQRLLQDRIVAAGLSGRVTFAGHRDDMADCLAALDILAAPSRWEGFGLMLAEAMAAGVPVVATAVGGIPAVASGAATLIPAEDPEALALAILALLRDPGRRAAMRAAGLSAAERFDWAMSATKLDAIYERIGGGR